MRPPSWLNDRIRLQLPSPVPCSDDQHSAMAPLSNRLRSNLGLDNLQSFADALSAIEPSSQSQYQPPTPMSPAVTAGTPLDQPPQFNMVVGSQLKPRKTEEAPSPVELQPEEPHALPLSKLPNSNLDIFSQMGYFSSSSASSSVTTEDAPDHDHDHDHEDDDRVSQTSCRSSAVSSSVGSSSLRSSSNPAKAKTVLCKYYLSGDCSRGDKCSFAHGSEDLRKIDYESKSAADSAASEDSHRQVVSLVPDEKVAQNRKTKLCRNLFEDGMCPFSVNCNFAHSLEELRKSGGHHRGNGFSSTSNSNTTTVSSSSSNANSSSSSHNSSSAVSKSKDKAAVKKPKSVVESKSSSGPLYKTRMCKHYFKTGKCWLQEDCRFAHGIDELRKGSSQEEQQPAH